MGFPEKNTKVEQASNGMNIFLFFVLVIIIICTAAVAYLNSRGIDLKSVSLKELVENKFFIEGKDKYEINSYEIKYDANMHPVFGTHKNYIVKCTKDSIKYLDKKGEEQWSFPVLLNKPLIKSAGAYLMVADLGGKDIYVFSGKDKKWEKKLDNNIINADISKSGYVSVVHEEQRCRAAVTVFNRQGMSHFTAGRAENFILSSMVSPSGNKVFINSIDSGGINIKPVLEITDIYGTVLAGRPPKETGIFASIWYLNDDVLLAVGDSDVVLLGKDLKEKWHRIVKGKIYSSGIVKGKYPVIALSSEESTGVFGGDKTDVLIMDSDGKKVADYHIKEEVKSIKVYDNTIAANSGRHVYFIDSNGKLIGNYNSKAEIKDVQFFNNKEVLVVTRDSIIAVEIN